ncbi:hypothetical protein TrCOL_g5854 [Triparma columacea]|uniref:EGF-like domain-containing protein n=1 Tax=Triparma columacea TaxID=722753 RepID=A0A9W7LF47_9STRA|nr:hypothetical protein TrCOL_g5854 [Triparma columacea]
MCASEVHTSSTLQPSFRSFSRFVVIALSFLLLSLLPHVSAVNNDGLEICRNLHLDQQLSTIPSTTPTLILEWPIGYTHTGDADVSALLDPSDTSRFAPSVKFKLTLSSPSSGVRLYSITYLDDEGNGVLLDLSTQEAYDALVEDEGEGRLTITIPHSSYINPDKATWTDMRDISISVLGPPTVAVVTELLRLCSTYESPAFCSIPTSDSYQTSCSICRCQTCHNCGCSAIVWGGCSHGSCTSNGCWCSPACKCCEDCAGYECNCEQCCEQAVVEGCSIGGTFKVNELSPSNGIGGGNTTIQVLGEGFFRNAGNITCQFGEKTTPGVFVSSSSITCVSPPVDMGGADFLDVPFSLSLDGLTFTDPTTSHFKYIDCPGGCSDNCGAEECRCPQGMYGSTCQHVCDCVNADGCASLTGDCHCRYGWTGEKCDVLCPGETSTCDGNGACYLGDEGNGECVCFGGFWGEECGGVCPGVGGKVCGGRGECEKDDGLCDCRQGYYGPQCELECPGGGSNSCSGNGVCCTGLGSSKEFSPCDDTPIGNCACEAGWRGSACSERYCFQGCFGNGVCGDGGICACEEGWGGEFCNVESGTDPSKAYIQFDRATYFTSESLGTVKFNVTRYGNIDEDVSVMFKTVGLTATPGKDYIEANERLLWVAESGEPKEISIIIMRNEGVSEGEESFELTLTSPVPKGKCALGKTHTAVVKIAAKEDNVGKNTEIAMITIHIMRDDGRDLEFMKKKFASSTVTATGLEASQVVFPSDSVAIVGDNVLSLEFHILPSSSSTKSVRDGVKDFLGAMADPTSALYTEDMKKYCPIDISFQPDVQIVVVDPTAEGGGVNIAAIILPILMIFVGGGGILWLKRKEVREWLLRRLAQIKFQEMQQEDNETVNAMHQSGEGGMDTFRGIKREFDNMKRRYFGGAAVARGYNDVVGGDFELNEYNTGEEVVGYAEVVGREEGTRGVGGFASGVVRSDEADIVRVGKGEGGEGGHGGDEPGGSTKLISKKKIIQIEL